MKWFIFLKRRDRTGISSCDVSGFFIHQRKPMWTVGRVTTVDEDGMNNTDREKWECSLKRLKEICSTPANGYSKTHSVEIEKICNERQEIAKKYCRLKTEQELSEEFPSFDTKEEAEKYLNRINKHTDWTKFYEIENHAFAVKHNSHLNRSMR